MSETKTVSARLTSSDHLRVVQLAKKAKMTVSDYIIDKILNNEMSYDDTVVADLKDRLTNAERLHTYQNREVEKLENLAAIQQGKINEFELLVDTDKKEIEELKISCNSLEEKLSTEKAISRDQNRDQNNKIENLQSSINLLEKKLEGENRTNFQQNQKNEKLTKEASKLKASNNLLETQITTLTDSFNKKEMSSLDLIRDLEKDLESIKDKHDEIISELLNYLNQEKNKSQFSPKQKDWLKKQLWQKTA